ncbi:asparagine synthase (glutamine-hydrolyzing) [uncultured Pseudoxanthomonas sp.]|uniref:asparagine synthase (glutamine-hydrolyzing) n=1 Tax=uncultured Pseudoxanthomonas sp. TaxID=281701 RepID=UPI00262C953F|nr:asparagine synthase (glutamine-hydrolyzing) [uncultured Pseudoxanthomonas sp.]
MCGLAGMALPAGAPPPSAAVLEAMIGTLHHRGPDGSRCRVDGSVGLAHARLSIIDLDGGWQPMADAEGSLQLVFNGEIFNHVELRRELERQGHVFATRSDTEVILHLYARYGDDFVDHLNGQFAVALHDVRRQRLVLARDRIGIRPLYYYCDGSRLAFASEIKALRAAGLPLSLDVAALGDVFGFWCPLGERTTFDGVRQLPPGHRMVVDLRVDRLAPRITPYWAWQPQTPTVDAAGEDACAEELHALLVDAVRLQLRSDVPVGAYLSGGLDSSAIASLALRHAGADLRTFSLAFEDTEFDERPFQRLMAQALGTRHSEITVSQADIATAFRDAVWHAEMPLVRTAPVPMLLLAGHVRDHGYKVVLTGEGADEVFAGYDLFKEAQARRFMARGPGSRWRGRILERLYPYLAHSPARSAGFAAHFFAEGGDPASPGFAHAARLRSTRRVLRFLHPDLRAQVDAVDPLAALAAQLSPMDGWAGLDRDQYVEASTLLPGYLLAAQGDRMAMARSIEGRYPFLDHRVIEFANRMPPTFKLRGLREKRLLKRAMANELPSAITQRHKQPYRAPDSQCFFADGQLRPWVADMLAPDRLAASGLFDVRAIGHLVEKCRAGRAIGYPDNMAFVGVLSLLVLQERFLQTAGPGA